MRISSYSTIITKSFAHYQNQSLTVVAGAKIKGDGAALNDAKVANNLIVEGTLDVVNTKNLTLEGTVEFKSGSEFISSGTTILTKGATINDKS